MTKPSELLHLHREFFKIDVFDIETVAITMERVQKSIAITGIVAVVLGISAYISTHSQPKKSSDFLGISFKNEFLKETPTCVDEEKADHLCRVPTSDPQKFEIRGLPYLPIHPGYSLIATVDDGKISQFTLSGKAVSLELVEIMLRHQFGEPSTTQDTWEKTGLGPSFNNRMMTWSGNGIEVDFHRLKEDFGRYSVTVSRGSEKLQSSIE
ncbi:MULTISPECIES: hypothetical protein [Pseudomonas]|uniref:hypothetical protein n=1 Tax=Pseudomonas TaxID=286 RepID=UPI0015DC3AE6|nr:hypothetical protein [Pseudomonas putida]BBR53859.1 hypothetical protein WP4W18C03_21860 [Pseudomonas putida]